MAEPDEKDVDVQAEVLDRQEARADEFAALFAMLDRPAESASLCAGYVQLASRLGAVRQRCANRG